MKKVSLSIALAATIALTGCAEFFVSQNSGSGGGNSTTSGFFYVLNSTTEQVVGYQVNNQKLATLSGGTLPVMSSLTAITISPNNKYLYLGFVGGIYAYSINSSTGALTQVTSTAISSDTPVSMQVDLNNEWLVYVIAGTSTLVAQPLNTSTGLSTGTAQTANLTASTGLQLVIAPDNKHVFVALQGGGTDDIPFTASATNPFGTDKNYPVYTPNGGATTITVDPKSQFLYIGEAGVYPTANNSGGLRVLFINTDNTLTEQTNSNGYPYACGGIAPAAILVDNADYFVYVANQTTSGTNTNNVGNLTGFATTISTTAGTTTDSLSALSNSPFSTGFNTYAVAEDNSHSFVIALNKGGSQDMDIYTFNSNNTGNLSNIISATTGTTAGPDPTGPSAIAVAH
jgi:6-phosphogluconolactonase (cycloisomerase 2 family)